MSGNTGFQDQAYRVDPGLIVRPQILYRSNTWPLNGADSSNQQAQRL